MSELGQRPHELRIDYLMRRIHEGAKSVDLPNPNLIARKSELNASHVIRGIEGVANVYLNPPKSYQDLLGRDLTIKLKVPVGKDVDLVYVQVKSSKAGIDELKQFLRREMHLTPIEVEVYLLEHERLIVINGRLKDAQIAKSFASQLNGIKKFSENPSGIDWKKRKIETPRRR